MNLTAQEYLAATAKPKRSKYGAKRCFVDGVWFHSIAEGNYYRSLQLRQRAGEISAIFLQPEFQLIAGFDIIGKYRADFEYFDRIENRNRIVDVKGFDTPLSKWKRKHVKAQYGVEVEIIK